MSASSLTQNASSLIKCWKLPYVSHINKIICMSIQFIHSTKLTDVIVLTRLDAFNNMRLLYCIWAARPLHACHACNIETTFIWNTYTLQWDRKRMYFLFAFNWVVVWRDDITADNKYSKIIITIDQYHTCIHQFHFIRCNCMQLCVLFLGVVWRN